MIDERVLAIRSQCTMIAGEVSDIIRALAVKGADHREFLARLERQKADLQAMDIPSSVAMDAAYADPLTQTESVARNWLDILPSVPAMVSSATSADGEEQFFNTWARLSHLIQKTYRLLDLRENV